MSRGGQQTQDDKDPGFPHPGDGISELPSQPSGTSDGRVHQGLWPEVSKNETQKDYYCCIQSGQEMENSGTGQLPSSHYIWWLYTCL